MNENRILETIQNIFRDVFANDSIVINRNTNANDIEEWDSINHIIILESVQNEYNIEFELDEIIEMKNVGDMIDAVIKKIERKK